MSHYDLISKLLEDGVLKTKRIIEAFMEIDRADFVKKEYEAIILWALLALFLHKMDEIKFERTHSPYFWGGFGAYLLATLIWEPSSTGGTLCHPDTLFEGHALWHILGAVAMWCFYKYFRTEVDRA